MHVANVYVAEDTCLTRVKEKKIGGKDFLVGLVQDVKATNGKIIGYTELKPTHKQTYDQLEIGKNTYRVFHHEQFKPLPEKQLKYCICVDFFENEYLGVARFIHRRHIRLEKDENRIFTILKRHKVLITLMIPLVTCFCMIATHLFLEQFKYKIVPQENSTENVSEEVTYDSKMESVTVPGGTIYQFGSPLADTGQDVKDGNYTDEQSTNRDIMGIGEEEEGNEITENYAENEDAPIENTSQNTSQGTEQNTEQNSQELSPYSEMTENELIDTYINSAEKSASLKNDIIQGVLEDEIVSYNNFDTFNISKEEPIISFSNNSSKGVTKTFAIKIDGVIVWESQAISTGRSTECNLYELVGGKSKKVVVIQQCKSLVSDENTLSAYNDFIYESEVVVNVQQGE